MLRLVFGKVAFLFTGDAGKQAEAGMLAAGEDVQAQILKVGHHGSSSASSPAFLAAVKPQVAIYCCGVGNSYGHPHAETLTALADVGAKVYGTDVNGTVVVTSDGTTYQVDPRKGRGAGSAFDAPRPPQLLRPARHRGRLPDEPHQSRLHGQADREEHPGGPLHHHCLLQERTERGRRSG